MAESRSPVIPLSAASSIPAPARTVNEPMISRRRSSPTRGLGTVKANAESLCLPWMKAARARAMPTAAAEKPAWYP